MKAYLLDTTNRGMVKYQNQIGSISVKNETRQLFFSRSFSASFTTSTLESFKIEPLTSEEEKSIKEKLAPYPYLGGYSKLVVKTVHSIYTFIMMSEKDSIEMSKRLEEMRSLEKSDMDVIEKIRTNEATNTFTVWACQIEGAGFLSGLVSSVTLPYLMTKAEAIAFIKENNIKDNNEQSLILTLMFGIEVKVSPDNERNLLRDKIGADLFMWSKERFISKKRVDREGYCTNIAEERFERLEAVLDNDLNEIADALCDVGVFSTSELSKLGVIIDMKTEIQNSDTNIMGVFPSMIRHADFDFKMTFLIGKLISINADLPNAEDEIIKYLIQIIALTRDELRSLNLDEDRCFEECHKEISSRTGAWNDEAQKWKKFQTEEAKALWYKADYTQFLVDKK